MMRSVSRIGAALIVALLSIVPVGDAQASTSCLSPHCYSQWTQQFTPAATEVWTTLDTYCQVVEPDNFDTNELWAVADPYPGGNNYVEFGQAKEEVGGGVPTDHWFWARTNGGVQKEYDLPYTFAHNTVYNATILYNTSAGYWQFYQGGTLYGQGSSTFPSGPIAWAVMGGEMMSQYTNTQQNSFDDGVAPYAGRVQSGVRYTGWSGGVPYHDVPPYSTNWSQGSTHVRDYNPNVGGLTRC